MMSVPRGRHGKNPQPEPRDTHNLKARLSQVKVNFLVNLTCWFDSVSAGNPVLIARGTRAERHLHVVVGSNTKQVTKALGRIVQQLADYWSGIFSQIGRFEPLVIPRKEFNAVEVKSRSLRKPRKLHHSKVLNSKIEWSIFCFQVGSPISNLDREPTGLNFEGRKN